jgi:tetratricopeptide (TPR) repeat protein
METRWERNYPELREALWNADMTRVNRLLERVDDDFDYLDSQEIFAEIDSFYEAIKLFSDGKFDEAHEIFESLIYIGESNSSSQLRDYFILSELYDSGDYIGFFKAYERGLAAYRENHSSYGTPVVYFNLRAKYLESAYIFYDEQARLGHNVANLQEFAFPGDLSKDEIANLSNRRSREIRAQVLLKDFSEPSVSPFEVTGNGLYIVNTNHPFYNVAAGYFNPFWIAAAPEDIRYCLQLTEEHEIIGYYDTIAATAFSISAEFLIWDTVTGEVVYNRQYRKSSPAIITHASQAHVSLDYQAIFDDEMTAIFESLIFPTANQ